MALRVTREGSFGIAALPFSVTVHLESGSPSPLPPGGSGPPIWSLAGGARRDFGHGNGLIFGDVWCLGCPRFSPSPVTQAGWSVGKFQGPLVCRSVSFWKGKRGRLGFRERDFRETDPALFGDRSPPKLVGQRPSVALHFRVPGPPIWTLAGGRQPGFLRG